MPIPDVKTDQAAEATGRLTDPFKNKPRIKAFVEAFCEECADLESLGQSGFSKLLLDNAEGEILDLWGETMGLPRDGRSDDEYRADLRGWVVYLTSNGNPESLITLLLLLAYSTDDMDGADVWLMEYSPAHVIMVFDGTYFDGPRMTKWLDDAACAGVSVKLVHYDPTSPHFCFDGPDVDLDGEADDDSGFDTGLFADLIDLH
ncbi:MAG: DUF2612 domain-containing protein [Synergistaceae bacterium]|jgi:hypothetical protein|nr:DUF2612 domain-containing protein [Synergistaceae bacterium]